jgi:hypothetical protein
MGRLRRFPDHRYVGIRDDMTVVDCDDDAQFAALSERIEEEDLVGRCRLQAFAPDTPAEARNRGFRPLR